MCGLFIYDNNKDTRAASITSLYVKFEQILHIVLMFLLLTLNK